MNMRGVFLHVMADALGSVVVIISAIIIWQTDWEYKYYVDPGRNFVIPKLPIFAYIIIFIWSLRFELDHGCAYDEICLASSDWVSSNLAADGSDSPGCWYIKEKTFSKLNQYVNFL